jgi:hypothetical protein
MLAQYNLGVNYKQITSNNYVAFSDNKGWEYNPGPKEINIQEWSTNPKKYVNSYVEYLKTELGDKSITGNLITLKELESLGCNIPSNYGYISSASDKTCQNSLYKFWLINGQYWWTCSIYSDNSVSMWMMYNSGYLDGNHYTSAYGVRPTITISKDALKKSFS